MVEFSEFIHILDRDMMNRTPVGTKQSILNSFRYDRVQRVHPHPGPRHHEQNPCGHQDHDIMNRTPVGTKQSILSSFRYDRVQ
jgi:hypothetical protein